jgi:hypothetical protein
MLSISINHPEEAGAETAERSLPADGAPACHACRSPIDIPAALLPGQLKLRQRVCLAADRAIAVALEPIAVRPD